MITLTCCNQIYFLIVNISKVIHFIYKNFLCASNPCNGVVKIYNFHNIGLILFFKSRFIW